MTLIAGAEDTERISKRSSEDSSAGKWEVKVNGGGFLCKTFLRGGDADDEERFLVLLGMTGFKLSAVRVG
jgi:hypothetical protein